jgi:hypothetical protein
MGIFGRDQARLGGADFGNRGRDRALQRLMLLVTSKPS